MTTFTGKLLEYSFVSIDRFNGENLNSTVYFLSHCHKDHIEGLLDEEFIKRLQSTRSSYDIKLYTSETTKNLMLCDKEMEHLVDYVVGLPIHQPVHLNVFNENSKDENIIVTLISAGHCVGSVMILLEGRKGKVLYTGDFRLGDREVKKISNSLTNLKSMYVDTTFCCPSLMQFPTRENTKDCIINIVKSWIEKGPNYMVHLKCKGRYGYEYIMKEVAKYFGVKLHVNEWRLRMSARLPNMLKHFSTVSTDSQIHCCYYGKESFKSSRELPCGLRWLNGKPIKLITIVPSSLYFMKKGAVPENGKLCLPQQNLWRVFHSMHASYNEIRDVVSHFKPENIYPCVPPVDCQDILVAYDRLQDLKGKPNHTGDNSQESDEQISDRGSSSRNGAWKDEIQKANIVKGNFLASPDKSFQSPPPIRKRKHGPSNVKTAGKLICSTPEKDTLKSSSDKGRDTSIPPNQKSGPKEIEFIEESTIKKVKEDDIENSLNDDRILNDRDVTPIGTFENNTKISPHQTSVSDVKAINNDNLVWTGHQDYHNISLTCGDKSGENIKIGDIDLVSSVSCKEYDNQDIKISVKSISDYESFSLNSAAIDPKDIVGDIFSKVIMKEVAKYFGVKVTSVFICCPVHVWCTVY